MAITYAIAKEMSVQDRQEAGSTIPPDVKIDLLDDFLKDAQNWETLVERKPTLDQLREYLNATIGVDISNAKIGRRMERIRGVSNFVRSKRNLRLDEAVDRANVMTEWMIKLIGSVQIPSHILRDIRADERLPVAIREAEPVQTLKVNTAS